ncbi:hypothetical protein DN069_06525 [Streptacidiphilus pinicola]|uniref:Uncharacterized protein n=1 Tax=Streptacidiphilus pinicola TaxID=2219663 RepID=A0A2X0IT58_9ACTN|nr:hypothetical protein [Streptacidiphilus pinicola]RAG86461.1 hypothetical protein DN069_06525 [Streptacidiphilus pinicola]
MLEGLVLGATSLMLIAMGYAMFVDFRGLSTKTIEAHNRFWRGWSRQTMAAYRRGGIAFMAFGVLLAVLTVWSVAKG